MQSYQPPRGVRPQCLEKGHCPGPNLSNSGSVGQGHGQMIQLGILAMLRSPPLECTPILNFLHPKLVPASIRESHTSKIVHVGGGC